MKRIFVVSIIGMSVFAYGIHFHAKDALREDTQAEKTLRVIEDGVTVVARATGNTVDDFLAQAGWSLDHGDRTIPPRTTRVTSGMVIEVIREHAVTVDVDGTERTCKGYASDVGMLLRICGIAYTAGIDDITPPLRTPIINGMTISVAHVETREEERNMSMPFKTITRADKSLPFGTTRTVQKGKKGRVRVIERVTYKGGKEVQRKEVRRIVIEKPQDEIIAKGTKLKLGKKHTGQASWYAYKGCDCAANPWLPKGSYVKVTNKANGKSVVVRINDRGPFVPGRIIDLDKVAFKKIASPGAGVIDVIMEEVKQ